MRDNNLIRRFDPARAIFVPADTDFSGCWHLARDGRRLGRPRTFQRRPGGSYAEVPFAVLLRARPSRKRVSSAAPARRASDLGAAATPPGHREGSAGDSTDAAADGDSNGDDADGGGGGAAATNGGLKAAAPDDRDDGGDGDDHSGGDRDSFVRAFGFDEAGDPRVIPIKPAPEWELPGFVATEDAIALAFAAEHAGRFIYDHSRGAWFCWDGAIWRRDTVGVVPDAVRSFTRAVNRAQPKPLPALARERTWGAIERAARADQRLACDHARWNRDPWLLGVPNGVVDLRTGELMPPDPRRFISMGCSVSPAPPGTPHPVWSHFSHEVTCGNRELERCLQQETGYWASGDTSRETFTFFEGKGGNGKGTFVKTITSILGDYATTAPIGMFMVSRYEAHPTELARLANARLVTAFEIEEGTSWALAKIKALTGNEGKIPARFVGCDHFEFVPQCKLCFVGNHRPRLASVDDAITRRLNLIPFTFKPAVRDEALKEKLIAEYPAILRWMIDGLLDARAHGVVRPAAVASATADYFATQDVLRAWIADCCELGRDHSELLKNLFASWRTWAEANNEVVGTSRALKERLARIEDIEFPPRRGSGIWVRGIRLRTGTAGDEPPPPRCAHCNAGAEAGELRQCGTDDGVTVYLHFHCIDDWRKARAGNDADDWSRI
jgi:P4 family phage/plasmid primase-like protien